MELTRERRQPLSRETRLLLVTILVSFAALWMLARIRFAERPVTPNPITPVLTQLAPPPVFEQLSPLLMGIEVRRSLGAVVMGALPALGLETDIALAVLNQSTNSVGFDLGQGRGKGHREGSNFAPVVLSRPPSALISAIASPLDAAPTRRLRKRRR